MQTKVLIKADLSQAEYRVLVFKARITRVIDRWVEDRTWSIHKWNATENIYRKPWHEITPTEYSYTKNGTFGANYNIGAPKVSRMYDIPLKEAKMILERYHNAMPEVRGVYQEEIQKELRDTRVIRNPLGRERIFLGRMDDDTFRDAYSHYCQSTVGDLINAGLADLHDIAMSRPELGLNVLLQCHDEIVGQCFPHAVRECVDLFHRCMERPLHFPGVDHPLIIPADVKVGPNWHDTVSIEKWKEAQLAGAA